jgi:hypothetical protein
MTRRHLISVFEELPHDVQVKQEDLTKGLVKKGNAQGESFLKKSLINSYFKSTMQQHDENDIEKIVSDRYPIYPLVEDSKTIDWLIGRYSN